MRKRILILLVATLSSWVEGWTTTPTIEMPTEVENSAPYYHLVQLSPIPGLFSDCELAESEIPKYWAGTPERVSFKQIYLTPSHLSEFGVRYRLSVRITIDCDTILGFAQLNDRWADYKARIAWFESRLAVHRLLQVVRPVEINYDHTRFYSDGRTRSRFSYDTESSSFTYLLFRDPELIQSRDLFLPILDSLPWVKELVSKGGIGIIRLVNGKVTIGRDAECPSCDVNAVFDVVSSRLMSFDLSENQSWENFPMIKYVRQVVEGRLVGDSLASCKIGTGHGHTYIMLDRGFVDETWTVQVAIRCQERPNLRDVCFRVLPDSSVERFHVCWNNEP